jgi:hypothetical protein
MLLLTDGTLLVHDAYQADWLRFAPDPQNGYAGGRWQQPSTMANPRGFFASSLARDAGISATACPLPAVAYCPDVCLILYERC